MTTVLLDTNALLMPHQNGVDVFSEIDRILAETHEVVTLSTVVEELKGLSGSSSEDGAAARIGLKLLLEKKIRIVPATGEVDDAIVEYSGKNNVVVCTNDKVLKRRLKSRGVRTICLRGGTHLGLI
ncbi:MAG: hypothetical protein V1875_00505 [Candidatus Altiarchaeota archaeon]